MSGSGQPVRSTGPQPLSSTRQKRLGVGQVTYRILRVTLDAARTAGNTYSLILFYMADIIFVSKAETPQKPTNG